MDPETVAAVAARSGKRCEYPGCTRPGAHLHHRQLRRHGRHDPDNILLLCANHHLHVHMHPAEAYEAGFLVHSWNDPSEVPWDATGGP